MRPRAYLNAIALAGFLPCVVAVFGVKDARTRYSILISAAVSFLGYLATKAIIPLVKRRTLRAGLHGKDINKKGSEAGEKDIPESLGLAPGVVFLVRSRTPAPAPAHRRRSQGGGGGLTSLLLLLQVCIVLFQQLHYHDAASAIHSLSNGGKLSEAFNMPPAQHATDAW